MRLALAGGVSSQNSSDPILGVLPGPKLWILDVPLPATNIVPENKLKPKRKLYPPEV